jgi:hypothetical protein
VGAGVSVSVSVRARQRQIHRGVCGGDKSAEVTLRMVECGNREQLVWGSASIFARMHTRASGDCMRARERVLSKTRVDVTRARTKRHGTPTTVPATTHSFRSPSCWIVECDLTGHGL